MVRFFLTAAVVLFASLARADDPPAALVDDPPTADVIVLEEKPTKTAVKPPSVLVDPDHNCPSCGRSQFIVNRFVGDTHSHLCSSCGTEWFHKDPGTGIASQQLKSIGSVQSGGCVGGNCPTGYSQPSRGWRPGAILFGR